MNNTAFQKRIEQKCSNIPDRKNAEILPEIKGSNYEITEVIPDRDMNFTEALMECIPGLLYVYDDSYRLIKWNRKYEEMTGFTAEELFQRSYNTFFDTEDSLMIAAAIEEMFSTGYAEVEVHHICKGDKKLHILCNIVPLIMGDKTFFTGIGLDIANRKQSERIAEQLACYDMLTGLPNRTKAFNIVDDHIKNHKDPDHKDALLYIDIDNFKYINDTFGHLYGDQILKEVAEKLKTLIDKRIQVARFGGDEFIVFILDSDYGEVKSVAKTIMSLLDQNIELQGKSNYISVSIGIAIYPDHASSYEELMQYADTAMCKAKSVGKDRYEFFNTSLHEKLLERVLLESQLRLAITNQELLLHYQPQVDLDNGKIIGFEALVRWMSPEYGLISPLMFIPLAEETGLIIDIGDFVLRSSAIFAKKLQELGYKDLTISVNISVKQMNEKRFVEKILAIVNEFEINPSSIILEITESVLIESFDPIKEKLIRLRKEGFHISLDDFGTGYSSLTYLKLLPIDSLKIDKTFIDDIMTNHMSKGLTNSIIQIAHQLGLSVVAEGVEYEEQYQYLGNNQCDSVQGYYFSKPLPENQVLPLLQENRVKQ